MKDILNCPNCGAPIQDDICPYCGSVFLDWAAFDVSRPTFVKVKDHFGHIQLMKLGTGSISINYDSPNEICFYADDRPYFCARSKFPDVRIEAEFYVQPFFCKSLNQEVVHIDIDPEKADSSTVKEILKDL